MTTSAAWTISWVQGLGGASAFGYRPTLETRELDEKSFAANPSASNRIWILDKPLEEWLTGTVRSSQCCSVCGDSECRTVEVSGSTFEVIPEQLVVRAGLLAAAQLLDDTTAETKRA